MNIKHRARCTQPEPTRTPSQAAPGVTILACPGCGNTALDVHPNRAPNPFGLAADLLEASYSAHAPHTPCSPPCCPDPMRGDQ